MGADNLLRILFVEDVPTDVELVERLLRKEGFSFTSLRVETKEAFLKALEEFRPDLVISDYAMPEFDGMQALKLSLERDLTLPVILLTGSLDEETAVEFMKAGAADYVLKERVARLPFAVQAALERRKTQLAKEAAEEALWSKHAVDAALAELSTELLKLEARIEQIAPVVLRHAQVLTGSEIGYICSLDPKTGDILGRTSTEMIDKDCRDISGSEMCQASPKGAEKSYPGLWGHSLNTREPFFTNEPDRHPAAVGVPQGHIPIRNFLSVPVVVENELLGQIALANSARDYTSEELETVRRLAVLYGMFLRDRRAKQDLSKSEEQLRQAQKMEAVGRLAGGVAHDFNNMLQVILGNADLALAEVQPDSPLGERILEISKAGQRAADLTRQLLAFARKQTIAPKVLDLNDTVAGMLKMLGRLIGEDIDLVWKPANNLCPVMMDPAQIDQLLANVVVNARDAIASVGKVTIVTENAEFDEAYCQTHIGSVPGQFVRLEISDNGSGIDRKTLANIFEPFFTTKEHGKGTGLGLATVYGIVKQNNGFINVYSEPGQGTTFKIYLPRHEAEVLVDKTKRKARKSPIGKETVLLVEDEESLLQLSQKVLKRLGYKVLMAEAPNKALHLAEEHEGKIHLLITDVVLPEMSGRDLFKLLKDRRPDIKCLFMSGYTADIIAHHGILDEGIHFIEKPFSLNAFAEKIRKVLDE